MISHWPRAHQVACAAWPSKTLGSTYLCFPSSEITTMQLSTWIFKKYGFWGSTSCPQACNFINWALPSSQFWILNYALQPETSSTLSGLCKVHVFPSHFQLFPNHPSGFPYQFPFFLFLTWFTRPSHLQEPPGEKGTDLALRPHRRKVNFRSVQKQKAYCNVPTLGHLLFHGQSC